MGTASTLAKLGVCALAGVVFGVALEKGRVFEPRLIRQQMVLRKQVMLKMFLSAVASALFSLSLLAMLPATRDRFMQASSAFYDSLKGKSLVAATIGGLLLGAGMTLSGACPGMVLAQIGAGTTNAGYTFLGALAGTLLYGVLKPVLDPVIHTGTDTATRTNPYKDSPYFVLSLPLVAMFGMLVFAIELLIPWTKDIKIGQQTGLFTRKAWPPYISGAMIGLLQVPIVLTVGDTLGGSSAYGTLLSQVLVGPFKKIAPSLSRFRRGIANWWQVAYVLSAVLGAYLSSTASGTYGRTRGVPVIHAFIGGALMTFGARIGGGCTSGHGISGMGLLSILSLVAVAAMFGGAMFTAVTLQGFGMLAIKK